MPSPAYDLNYLEAGLGQLKTYLLSDELFWPLGASASAGQTPYPQLTLGNLLFARARLRALEKGGRLKGGQLAQTQRLETQLERLKNEWRTAWEDKAAREFASRLRQWQNYLDELGQNPESHGGYYKSEARTRALLALLDEELKKKRFPEREILAALDARLKRRLKRGDFLWEEELQAGFPQAGWWFLWGEV
jgi:hypothetical protein